MSKPPKAKKSLGTYVGIVLVATLFGLVVWVLYGQSQAPPSTNKNRVENAAGGSPSLVTFLEKDYTGCDKIGQQGVYRIIKEVPNFARLGYGCNNTDAYIIAQRKDGRWSLISPTNQFTPNGIPSCLMVDTYHISGALESKCFVSLDPLVLRAVTW